MAISVGVTAASVAIGSGALAAYRSFKAKRRRLPYDVRNSGFWTDHRLIRAEALFWTVTLGVPWSLVILAAGDGFGLVGGAVATLCYPFIIWLILSGLNLPLTGPAASIDRVDSESR